MSDMSDIEELLPSTPPHISKKAKNAVQNILQEVNRTLRGKMAAEYLIVSFIVFPTYLLFIFYLWLFKTIVYFLIKMHYGEKVEDLDCSDTIWTVGENYHNLINIVMFLNKKDGESDIEKDTKTVIQERLLNHPKKFGKMMCSLHTFLGYPFLVRQKVTADDFVNVIDIQKTKYNSMQDMLFAYSNKPMPLDDKLLWELIIVNASDQWKRKNDIKENQIPVFIRINHVIGDGLCIMNLVAHVFGENNINMDKSLSVIPSSPAWTRIPPIDSLQKLLLFFMTPGYYIVNIIKTVLNPEKYEGPVTSSKHNIAFRTEKSGDNLLETIKALKRDIGDTGFSEIILTAISGSLFSHFQKNYYKVPKSVPIAVVVARNLKPMTVNGVPVLRNQIGIVYLDIPLRISSNSQLHRLEKLKEKTRALMKNPDIFIRNYISDNLLQYMPVSLVKRIFPSKGVWGLISNLPQYPKVVLFNGYEVEDSFFFTPQRDQMATGFTIVSYDNRIHFGFVADVASVTSQGECDEIVNNIFTNIELLKLEVEKRKMNII